MIGLDFAQAAWMRIGRGKASYSVLKSYQAVEVLREGVRAPGCVCQPVI